MAKSKKPSGISITRKNYKFTVKWNKGEKYSSDQELEYAVKTSSGTTKYKSVSISRTASSAAFTLNENSYYPNTKKTIKSVLVRVRGKSKNESWSDWADKSIKIKKPSPPKVSASLTAANEVTFSLEKPAETESKHVKDLYYEYRLVSNYNGKKDTPKYWVSINGSGTTTVSKNVPINRTILYQSQTIILRVCSRGIGGKSVYKYALHVFSVPYKPKDFIVNSCWYDKVSKVISATCSWTADSSSAYPIDGTAVEYLIGTPVVSYDYEGTEDTKVDPRKSYYEYDEEQNKYVYVEEPVNEDIENYFEYKAYFDPPATGWETYETQKDTKSLDKTTVHINNELSFDQCLWLRVSVYHDGSTIPSDPALAKKGELQPPTDIQVTPEEITHRATVSVVNNSAVAGSFIALIYQDNVSSDDSGKVIGVIPSGSTSVDVQCPNWTGKDPITFGAYAVLGDISKRDTRESDNVIEYAINADMESVVVYKGGEVPVAPTGVDAYKLEGQDGVIQVKWNTPWLEATGVEVSWADHDDAWYSTDGPSSYTVPSIKQPILNIRGLSVGQVWYVRVRLYREDGGNTIYGPPSSIYPVDLSVAPAVPVLSLSEPVAPPDRDVKASWTYVSYDGTEQIGAELYEVIQNGGELEYSLVATSETAQYVVFKPQDEEADRDWELGSTHDLVVRVTSEGQKTSEWSNPITFTVAEPPECDISSTTLEKVTVNPGQEDEYHILELHELPLTIAVSGGGESDNRYLIIRRFDDYTIERPDNSNYYGYEGETIYQNASDTLDPFEITIDSLNDSGTQFDDGAKYQIVAQIQDSAGQVGTKITIPDPDGDLDDDGNVIQYEYFTVNWTHQAAEPSATVSIREDGAAQIDIGSAPVISGQDFSEDSVYIYRLSAGDPKLIYAGALFNNSYIDPYPTIGKRGGYRVVLVTKNGDYYDEDYTPAWIDIYENAHIDTLFQLIDFDDQEIEFKFNVKFNNSWNKQFTLTHYLGGKIEGDWLEGTEHTNSINGVVIDDVEEDAGTYDALVALAEYSGICHIRTIEGFNYTADIQVNGDSSEYNREAHPHDISLTVTEVDNPDIDGMTLADWEAE